MSVVKETCTDESLCVCVSFVICSLMMCWRGPEQRNNAVKSISESEYAACWSLSFVGSLMFG